VWSAAFVGAVAVPVVLIVATAMAAPDAQPTLLNGPTWRAAQDVGAGVSRGPKADAAWLSSGTVPGQGTRWADAVRVSLLDLHTLSHVNGAVAAGASARWNYAWPRDSAFAAVALARTGHQVEAVQALSFLQGVQLADGGFEARYLLDGSATPDDRAAQSDGAGWALWATGEVSRSFGDRRPPARLRALVERATAFALDVTDDGRRLPPASPDYWEVRVSNTSLGTVAPLLAGLRASQKMYGALGQPARARRCGAAASRLDVLVTERFAGRYERFGAGRFGYQVFGGGGGLDAAVTFLMPPFAPSPPAPVVDAWLRYQSAALRPAGGLAPGSQWKQDGISWTPETALVAYTAAKTGRTALAEHWMDWLRAHRTTWGSIPEKVLPNGAPAGPAPLAWTASLVVLTAAELESANGQ
jgi:GH15 family glucan-1,4-alpha-glucosidase